MRTETIIVIFIEREKRNLHIIDGSLSEALAIAILITYQERTIVICKVLGALNQLWGVLLCRSFTEVLSHGGP